MARKLYVVGNGFDLHHGIPSSYRAFGVFLKGRDRSTYDAVERYFTVDADFWSEFEQRLADFDVDALADDAGQFLVNYGAEDWSDAYHHDYQYEINVAVEAISSTLRSRFAEWVRQLPIPIASDVQDKLLNIDVAASFLNFNYTNSLEKIYGVPDASVLHIHGAGSVPSAELILGHGWEQEEDLDPYRFTNDPESADVRVIEGQQIIDGYFSSTFKPTDRIIRENESFFNSLVSISEIDVMGHSVSSIDVPYFSKIIEHIDRDKVRWRISYHGDDNNIRSQFQTLGIKPELVEYLQIQEFGLTSDLFAKIR